MLNLFNTAALAEQKSFYVGSNSALAGCDGELLEITSVYALDYNKLVNNNEPNPLFYWKITFSQPKPIKTALFCNREDGWTWRFPLYTATVGNNTDVTSNPPCAALGTMPDGGWYLCPTTMIGTTFGIYSTI